MLLAGFDCLFMAMYATFRYPCAVGDVSDALFRLPAQTPPDFLAPFAYIHIHRSLF
jgi:hypothetical protein